MRIIGRHRARARQPWADLLLTLQLLGLWLMGVLGVSIALSRCAPAVPPLTFAQYAAAHDTARSIQAFAHRPSPEFAIIAETARRFGAADPEGSARLLCAALRQVRAEHPNAKLPDARRLALMAGYESTFNVACIGGAGERGLLQIHPCHRKRMSAMGLRYGSEPDRLYFGLLLYSWHGLAPWGVRSKVLRAEARHE